MSKRTKPPPSHKGISHDPNQTEFGMADRSIEATPGGYVKNVQSHGYSVV